MTMIALDIGHGINTFPPSKGVYRNGKAYHEHEFNSDVAMRLKTLLEQHGFSVWMPQPPNSREVGLTTRTNAANRRRVDLYWSIHANAGSNDVDGCCSFYWHTSSSGKRLANIFADEMDKAGFELHGNGTHASEPGKWTELHVCRETHMTAVLTENGFMTHDEDFENLFGKNKESYRQRVAETHCKILCRYFGVPYKGVKSSTKEEYFKMKMTKTEHRPVITMLEKWTDEEKYKNPLDKDWLDQARDYDLTYGDAIRIMYESDVRGFRNQ